MLVRMHKTSSPPEIGAVRRTLSERGCETRVIGLSVIVIGGSPADGEALSALPGVVSVEPIATAYKLAARAVHPEGTRVTVGNVEVGGSEFVVCAGPCAVETQSQMIETATRVAEAGARLLRGGAFKPRTSPYAFQGLGEEGLRMLAEAGREAGLPVVTEVVTPEDAGLVARYADALQVGARNMQSFALLKALGRAGKPVLLKRGLSATIEELLMAAEYIVAHGNPDVILCERGIRTFETATRNTLDLNAVALLKKLTHLPVLVDPSHGTGRRDLIGPLSHAAAAVGADGIIVEVHPEPDHALSDGAQSITPPAFAEIMHDLAAILPLAGRWLAPPASGPATERLIGAHRRRIDRLDEALLRLLNERTQVALRLAHILAHIKGALGHPLISPERERAVLDHVSRIAGGPLDAAAVTRLFQEIISETRAAQHRTAEAAL